MSNAIMKIASANNYNIKAEKFHSYRSVEDKLPDVRINSQLMV